MKNSLYVMIIAIVIFMGFTIAYFVEKIDSEDIRYYVESQPEFKGRPTYGDKDAPIELVIYLDPRSDENKRFMSEIFPTIDERYIKTGKMVFYPKNYLTEEDIIDKNERFIYAQTLSCVNLISPDKFFEVYFGAFKEDIVDSLGSNGIDLAEIDECIRSKSFAEIDVDMKEVELRGLVGASPWIYVGLKGVKKTRYLSYPGDLIFDNRIRSMETQLGIERQEA